MICIKCGRSLKVHRSRTNGKREVWGCPAQGCGYIEDLELWAPSQLEDRKLLFREYADRGHVNVWHWDGRESSRRTV